MSRSIIERIKELNLPADQYIVVGSGLLEVLNIRQAKDIDIVASVDLYGQLRQSRQDLVEDTSLEAPRLIYGDEEAEIWFSWPSEQGRLRYEDLMQDSVVVDGIRFVPLDFIEQWKRWLDRDKDKEDIRLIAKYREAKS